MGEVRLSKSAERDLLEIWFHIAADKGVETADYWIDRVEARLSQLSMFPQSGPARSDIAPEARVLVISRWLVLYRVIPDGVQVNRVVDAARDLGELDLADE
ncbi:type II toxin-antitoxin system RelE/ParE family toxin [Bradyrhizobium sp. 930_D9_N1_4]|uniref:type II toxin-antitoxin system RelE/ParE family toxin n=1 Tax=Bradyrhizobium sp. 930_D9_N1_4 TaxID=3240374 RepID=UPI003F8CB266